MWKSLEIIKNNQKCLNIDQIWNGWYWDPVFVKKSNISFYSVDYYDEPEDPA